MFFSPYRKGKRSFLRTDETITPASTIDISHESLIRNWDHVKKWAEAEAESAAMYRRIAEAAALYFGPDQEDPESLVRGHRLALGLQWYRDEAPTAAWAARYGAGFEPAVEFLERSRAAEETRVRKEREDAERERQREREMARKEQERLQG